jgi:hypothetical protein
MEFLFKTDLGKEEAFLALVVIVINGKTNILEVKQLACSFPLRERTI